MSELFRVRNWVFATMCISVHYNGTDSVAFEQISQRLQIPRFVEFPIAIRKYGNVLIALAWCLLFLFYARSSARDVYEYTKCRCACVEYRTYSLFASPISTMSMSENTGMNRRDWKHNLEIIARYVKVHLMQLRSTVYPTNLLFYNLQP